MILMYNYVDFYSENIQDTGETLTGLTGLKRSCDIRRDHVWLSSPPQKLRS